MQSVTPDRTRPGLGSSAFARRYLRNRVFFLFLRVLRCFSSPGSPPYVMDWRMDTWGFLMWVSPFRDLRINGYLLLPEAYRSLSRLSSALSAKASALCPFCLTFAFWYPSVGISGLDSHCLIDKINYRCLPILRLYIKDIRVTKVSAQVWKKGCWKLASIRAFYHTCICDAVATEWIEDSWGALTIITQIYMYAVFKVRYWLNLYQSYKKKSFLFILYHW